MCELCCHFEQLGLGPQCPIATPWWKGYVDYIISIVYKEQVDTLFSHLNSLDPYIKFTLEAPDNDGGISFMDTKYVPKSNHTIHSSVYRNPTYINCYLDWNSNHPVSAKKAVIHALIYRVKMFLSLLKS